MFSMIEIRRSSFVPLSSWEKLRRSSPYLCLGLLIYFPAALMPSLAAAVKALLALIGLIAMLTDGALVYFSGPSLLDRVFKTTVIQLSLPSNMMPRVLGMRIW